MSKEKKFVSILLGALISLIIIGLIIGIVSFFSMLSNSFEPIPYSKDYLYTYGFVIILLTLVFIAFTLLKRKRANFSYGLLAGLLPIGFVLVMNSLGYYDYLNPVDFDKQQWSDNNPKSYEMTRSLIKNDLINDLSKNEVIDLLGNNFVTEFTDDSTFVYQLDIARFAYFEVHFDKNDRTKGINYMYHD